mmetsp:Transcript_8924/g.20390  ORF Transcript_8924/g.20390 Transcript_8924/m.20390 type:complete len:226 (-) Transcript_8924:2383-3060(-)
MIHQRILLLPPPGLLRAVGARRSLEGLDLCRLVASPLPLEVDAPQVVAVELSEALGDAELLLLPRESSQLDLAHGADTIHSPPPLLVQLQDRVVGHREVGRKCVDPHAVSLHAIPRHLLDAPPLLLPPHVFLYDTPLRVLHPRVPTRDDPLPQLHVDHNLFPRDLLQLWSSRVLFQQEVQLGLDLPYPVAHLVLLHRVQRHVHLLHRRQPHLLVRPLPSSLRLLP